MMIRKMIIAGVCLVLCALPITCYAKDLPSAVLCESKDESNELTLSQVFSQLQSAISGKTTTVTAPAAKFLKNNGVNVKNDGTDDWVSVASQLNANVTAKSGYRGGRFVANDDVLQEEISSGGKSTQFAKTSSSFRTLAYIVGNVLLGFGLLTCSLFTYINFTKLAAAGDNPAGRKEALMGVGVCLLCTALLGAADIVANFLIHTFF